MEYIKVKDICDIKTGKYDANHAKENGKYKFFTCALLPMRADTYSFEGELVMLPGNGANLGEVMYYEGKIEAYQRTYVLHNIKVKAKYLFYFLKLNWKKYILRRQIGSATNYMKLEDILNFEIPYIPLEMQNKIVSILDKSQELLDKRKEQIEALDELVKSQFIEMFGDPVQNPFGWEVKPLLESGSCKNGMNFSATEMGIELQYLGVGDFKDLSKIEDVANLGKVNLNKMPSKEYLLQNGDIVFVRSNGNKALVGRCLAVYPNNVATTYSGFCIRYRKTDENLEIPYLLQVLKTDSMRKNMVGRGANIQNLNQQILGRLMIPIPPLELQKQYSDFVKQIDKLKFEMEQSLKELENNFNSLMQQAFSGKLSL